MINMDCANIFTEDTDINIIKSWLIGCSDGQTYPINDRFLPRIKCLEFNFDRIEEQWNNIIGYKYDYKIDDPNLEKVANDMLKNLNEFIDNVNKDPQKYFGDVRKKYTVHMSAVVDNIIEGYFDSEEEAEKFALSRGRALLHDKGMDGVDDEWHWDGNINIKGIETE